MAVGTGGIPGPHGELLGIDAIAPPANTRLSNVILSQPSAPKRMDGR